ncbi:SAM-dependent MidA family methyltransferase [Palleronia aestuarii]|uniref:SAM-dependent MidA family methyltransferase n=1 Tax=Palleronia aestuarii TaxID=568105 RepID=A0A2W7NC91_9RHOB|nr:SAM-dependent methyltransferase [Palleronia aestuarii]PZX17788.1 SAM-dependent MidA family methyltransferase [Palleronia aestuarii]
MTPLADLLVRQIAATGPMTIAEYMQACLLHPRYGYYTTRPMPLGAAGDFVTAPEISQMFGELVGLALAQAWLDRGAPDPVALVELGPGRGTLMADALRATRAVPGFHAAIRLHLLEASPTLRQEQEARLAGAQPTWIETVDALPEMPILLVANEFLDALPIRQFVRDGAGWRERLVGVSEGQLTFALSDIAFLAALEHRLEDTAPGDLVETCAPAEALSEEIGARIARTGGMALLIDYGAEHSKGDTFQALRCHRKESPLETPGEADLTAHVAFGPLARAAPCAAAPLTTQGLWLEQLGVTPRAEALAARLTGDALDAHIAAHRRLTHPGEMGDLFKVLALHDGRVSPPGSRHGP